MGVLSRSGGAFCSVRSGVLGSVLACVLTGLFAYALAAPVSAAAPAEQQASALFEADWQYRLQSQPEYATSLGEHRFDATLSDMSSAASRADAQYLRRMLADARLIERNQLDAQQKLSLDLFIYDKEQQLKAYAFYPGRVQPLTAYSGIHISLPQLVAQMPFATEADYRNYLARLDALPAHINGLIEQLREGQKSGWSAPKTSLRALPAMLRQLREQALDGELAQPLRQIPASIDKPVRDALVLAGQATLRNKVIPALLALEDVVRNETLPGARDSIGASALPGGADYYAFLAARQSSSSLSPAEIHALGLREVARLKADMQKAIARTGYQGSFAGFVVFANSDPRLFAPSADALLARYRRIVSRASAAAPRLFASVPGQELLVKPLSGPGAGSQGAAFYEAGSAARPATFIVNTTRLETRPLWEMETLALHEGVPGHHLQVARAAELTGLPAFRRHGWHAAFGEGWALYAETLGPELGFYKDAFSYAGHLNAELFRAARLVVDTGIHSQGWTRQQALDYLNANTANPASDNALEVERYIAWPGQALAYKLGQLRIRALREKAQAALGERFDVRRFHSAVLDNGALPLALLEREVEQWIANSAAVPAPVN